MLYACAYVIRQVLSSNVDVEPHSSSSAEMAVMAEGLADRQITIGAADNSTTHPPVNTFLPSASSLNIQSVGEETKEYSEGCPDSAEVVHRSYQKNDDDKIRKIKQYLQVGTYSKWRQENTEIDYDLRSKKVMKAVNNLYEKIQKISPADKQAYYEYRLLLSNTVSLTNEFPFLPVPPGFNLKCRITRNKNDRMFPGYLMHLERSNESDVLLMTAQKTTGTVYMISTGSSTMSTDSRNCIGYFEGSISGRKFTLYKNTNSLDLEEDIMGDNHGLGDQKKIWGQMLCIAYEYVTTITQGPRKFKVTIPKMISDYEPIPSRGKLNQMDKNQLLTFWNKDAVWNSMSKSFVLNFGGRVRLDSVKNFQICHPKGNETLLQFGRTDKNTFVLDFGYPFSPLQALSIALSSFDAIDRLL